jgi:hypothetical protein
MEPVFAHANASQTSLAQVPRQGNEMGAIKQEDDQTTSRFRPLMTSANCVAVSLE